MSLRFRLNLIIIVICVFALILGSSVSVINARQSVYEEVMSSLNLAKKLLGNTPVTKQLTALDNIRHLKIAGLEDVNNHYLMSSMISEVTNVPDFFVQFVRPEIDQLSIQLSDGDNGSILLLADPSDEIREAWHETLIFILVLLLLTVFISISVFLVVGRVLRPVDGILLALVEIEQGHLDRRLTGFNLPEFNRISKGINHLSEKLAQSKEDNRRLSKKALNVREDERRYLARELHDEMGQSLSAIKALSVSAKQGAQVDLKALTKIESICDRLFAVVRNRMRQLSPPLLSEFGLTIAINDLVDQWQGLAEITLELDSNLDKLAGANAIHLYRIVQEALTNVLKHAQADKVWIEISKHGQTDGAALYLSIKDNGVGFDLQRVAWRGGLVSITERVDSLMGTLKIESAVGRGTHLRAILVVGELSE